MPRSWSEARKNCPRHPTKDKRGRWCRCEGPGWRYRISTPNPVTGLLGKPQWSKSFPNKEKADADQVETRKRIKDGTYSHDRGQTVGEYLTAWLAARAAEGIAPTTFANYASAINAHLIPNLGSIRLGQLRTHHIQAMVTAISTAPGKRGRPPGPGRIGDIVTVLSGALDAAVRLDLVARNYAQNVTLPRVAKPKPVDLGRDVLATFLKHITGDRLACMWILLALYPTRRSEIIGLRWPDIDRAERRIAINQALTPAVGLHLCPYCGARHRARHFGPPKTAAGERVLPLVEVVDAALLAHRVRQDKERAAFGPEYVDHQLVFCEPDGQPISPYAVSDDFRRHMEGAGIVEKGAKIQLKWLRSSATTALHEDGVDMDVITAVAGHTPDGKTTRKHYLKVRSERARVPFETIASELVANLRSDQQSGQA